MKRQKDGVDVKGKSPCFPIYPADVERELSVLSVAAAGLWCRMFLSAHFSPHRGMMELPSGEPMNVDDIAKRFGQPKKDVAKLLAEMRRAGTFSEDERGCIYNRRMVRDTHISDVRKQAAEARWQEAQRAEDGTFAPANNGTLHQQPEINAPANDPAKRDAKKMQSTVPSSSSSFSSSSSEKKTPYPPLQNANGFELDVWVAARIAAHPNKKYPHQAIALLANKPWIFDPGARRQFEEDHEYWCKTELWTWKQGTKCPTFSNFVNDYELSYRGQRAPETESEKAGVKPKSKLEELMEGVR